MKSIYVPMNGESGGHVGPLGKRQTTKIRNYLKRNFPNALIEFHPNHYCCSAMIQLRIPVEPVYLTWEIKIIYLSVSDYRYFPNQFLVREAQHMKDWTGGRNHNWNGLDKIDEAIQELKAEIRTKTF